MSQTFNRFLGYENNAFVNDGTFDLNVNSITITSLSPSQGVSTSPTSTLISSSLTQSTRVGTTNFTCSSGQLWSSSISVLITGKLVLCLVGGFAGTLASQANQFRFTIPWADINPATPSPFYSAIAIPNNSVGVGNNSTITLTNPPIVNPAAPYPQLLNQPSFIFHYWSS